MGIVHSGLFTRLYTCLLAWLLGGVISLGKNFSLEEVSALLDNKPIWSHFNETCIRVDRREQVHVKALDQAAVVLAASILYKNWQRLGEVANATVDEFEDSKVMKGGTLYIMSVEHHKTATEGLVLDAVDHGRVLHYIDTIRMVQVGKTDSKKLFVLTGGRPLGNLSSKLKLIGGKYRLSLPSATRVRKIGATTVALTLRQMSHTINTEALHYQAIVGDQHDASAFKTMSHLWTGRESTPVADSEVPSET